VHFDVGCGVDLLSSGGIYEFTLQADRGNLIPCEIDATCDLQKPVEGPKTFILAFKLQQFWLPFAIRFFAVKNSQRILVEKSVKLQGQDHGW
jgi:hypothetical protein